MQITGLVPWILAIIAIATAKHCIPQKDNNTIAYDL